MVDHGVSTIVVSLLAVVDHGVSTIVGNLQRTRSARKPKPVKLGKARSMCNKGSCVDLFIYHRWSEQYSAFTSGSRQVSEGISYPQDKAGGVLPDII